MRLHHDVGQAAGPQKGDAMLYNGGPESKVKNQIMFDDVITDIDGRHWVTQREGELVEEET
eukprot:1700595-Pyramimonas_sp.AAC.1